MPEAKPVKPLVATLAGRLHHTKTGAPGDPVGSNILTNGIRRCLRNAGSIFEPDEQAGESNHGGEGDL